MAGGPPGINSRCAQQVSLDTLPRNSMPTEKHVNNVSIQTGEEFSMKFLQECAASRVLTEVHGAAPSYEENVGVPDVQDRQMAYEELARVLGLPRMDSACGVASRVLTEVHGVAPSYEENVGVPDVQDRQMVYEELARVLGLPRMDSACGSDITEYASAKGSTSQIDAGVHVSNESLHYMNTSANGHKPSKLTPEVCNDQASLLSTVPLLSQSDSSRSLCSDGSQSGKLKILCSFGGKILPRPSDGKLRYVGGETRIISVSKNPSWEELLKKTAGMCDQTHSIKYQLPGEDLDALISVSSDEDMQNMIDEYHGIDKPEGSQRLRIFLIPLVESETPVAIDANITQQSDTNYQYVVAVNGMIETDPNPQNNAKQSSAADMGNLMPNAEINSRNDKIFPFPLHPLEINDTLADKSQNLIKFPSSMPFPIQQADMSHMTNVKTIPLPHEESIGYSASSYHTPQVAVNLMKSHAPINKSDIVQPNITSQLILEGENLAPRRVEHSNRNFVLCSQEGIPLVEKTINPLSDNLVELLPASIDPVSYHGIPHAFSDSKLQEHGEKSAWPTQEDMTRSFSLNLGRQQSSFHEVSAAFPEKPVQVNGNAGFINTELQSMAFLPEPTNPVSVMASCQNSKLKTLDDQCTSSVEPLNKLDASHHLFVSSENVCTSNLAMISKELAQGLKNVNLEPVPCIDLELPKKQSQVCSSLAPTSSSVDMTHSNVLELNYLGKTSNALTKANLDGYSSWANNSEVAGLVHRSQQLSHDNGLVSPQTISHQSIGDLVDIGCQVPEVRWHENLVENAGWSMTPHTSALYEGKVSLFDDLSNYVNHRVESLNHVRNSGDLQKSKDSWPVNGIKQVLQNPVNHNAPPAEMPPSNFPVISDATNLNILSPFEEPENASPDLGSQDPNAGSLDNELFSDAMIAEMEADMFGLQIIKNADLEELRELGSGTFGTVYYGKWRGTDVAIKRIKKTCFSGRLSEQERLAKDFWREACILSNLHHPNVVAFYGVVPDGAGGSLATVAEFMANGSLRTALVRKDKSLDHRKKLIIAMDAAFGMEYLHSKNIVHFDLKCDNLLVNLRDPERPICKVGDFGLSRIKHNTLVSGGVRGTLPWMAPELLNGSTNRVDVFSFGIVLWEILTGEEPYANMHCGAIIGGIVKNTLRPPIPEWCDPEWRKLMEQCWSADPGARPSFTEITYMLRSMSNALQAKVLNVTM
ncbi:mitogen-activated protein kinase kinase kinase [Salvia divinorum]|uniref:Mitogen-activated protein kinase kinase kinase n=1 Tax=Salvia divinorum TaxID=28513 RepID=A0ABD1I8Y6_SALDI